MEIKFEYRDGSQLRKRFLNQIPTWPKLGNDEVLTLDGKVAITTADPRFPTGVHVVEASFGASSYWQDFGSDFRGAIEFAQEVLRRGKEAFA